MSEVGEKRFHKGMVLGRRRYLAAKFGIKCKVCAKPARPNVRTRTCSVMCALAFALAWHVVQRKQYAQTYRAAARLALKNIRHDRANTRNKRGFN